MKFQFWQYLPGSLSGTRKSRTQLGQRSWSRGLTFRPRLEPLEDRCLLASGLSATLVADIVPGIDSSNPEAISNVGGTLYFGAISNGAYGLFKSDGTADGTVLIKGNLPGFLDDFTPMNGFVFFKVRGADSLWRTDGTTAGTVFIHALSGNELTTVNGKLFFSNAGNDGTELWASDGTTAGTVQVKDIYPGTTTVSYVIHDPYGGKPQHVTYTSVNGSYPQWLTNLNGTLFFAATDGSNGSELWRSDGTAQGTVLVKNIAKGSKGSDPKYLTVVNGVLYFGAAGGMWKSDGTEVGTVLVKNVDAAYLRNVNGTLFFAGTDSTYGSELWKSDGTAAGTVMVKDINPGSAGSLTEEFFIGSGNAAGQLYFSANDGVHGREPWTSDGTPAGTFLLKDISPGSGASGPGWFTNVNGLVYFEADDPTTGQELWQSDATPAGTVLVQDIYPGIVGSSPNDLTSLNNKLYFDAYEPVHGRELWDPPAVEAPAREGTAGGDLLVGSYGNNGVLRYDEYSGAFVDRFDPHNLANLKNPVGGVVGPDGNLYVSSGIFEGGHPGVLRYDGATGAFLGVFASQNITSPRGVLFGPDGNLYVANGNEDADPASVERFDGQTGAFIDYFVAPDSGGLKHPSYMVFGPNGSNDGNLDLYVGAPHDGSVLRYDGTTGVFKDVFISPGSGGLNSTQGMVFGPDGSLFVASGNWFASSNGPFYPRDFPAGAILHFEGPSGPNPGALVGTGIFVAGGVGGLANPTGIVYGPDPSGNGKMDLYVASSLLHGPGNLDARNGTSEVLRYDAETGAFLGTFVAPDSGGLKFATFITFTETDPTTLNYNEGEKRSAAALAPVAAVVAAAVPSTPIPSSTYTPGPQLLISNPDPLLNCPPVPNHSPYTADEPYVAVNPTNPLNIVAEWMDHGQAGNVAGASFDGGKTWQNVAIPGISQCTGGTAPEAVNPWLSFAPNGDLYSIGLSFGLPAKQILVNKSTDGGLTWSKPPIQLNTTGNPARFDDKPSITADPTNPNFVYATWTRFTNSFEGNNSETMFARSTDGGQTWQPEQVIHNAPGNAFNWGHQIVVLPDGTLIDAFSEGRFKNNHQVALTLLRSTDHGQIWSSPISAAVQEPLVEPNVQPPNALVTDPDTGQAVEAHPMFPSIEVDPHSGNLYAVWIDARFSNFQCNSIALSMSSDGGLTWSTPIQVNQTPNSIPAIDRQAFNPMVAVAADGTVAVTYYDFRNNSAAPGASTDYWLATAPAPATNPSNWSEMRLTNKSFDLEQAPMRINGAFFLGDHEGLAAVGNDFVAVWGMPDGSSTDQESVFFRRATATSTPSVAALTSTGTGITQTLNASVAASQVDYLVGSNLSTAGYLGFFVQTPRQASAAPPSRGSAGALLPGAAHRPPRHVAVLDQVFAELSEGLSEAPSF